MSPSISLSHVYRGRINLWVEDRLTKEYLQDLWNSSDVMFHIAGNNEGVTQLVRNARENGIHNVFGIIDRDFRTSNIADWNNSDKAITKFVLPWHEIENCLLDTDGLHSSSVNTEGRTRAEIDARMERKAKELVWWMACRKVLSEIRHLLLHDFPPHPKIADVRDGPDALDHIVRSPWYRNFPKSTRDIVNRWKIDDWLQRAHSRCEADRASGAWRQTFSGKEIFRDVRAFIYQPPRPASPATHDVDVATTIAMWQVDNNIIPAELSQLLTALRSRVGIP